MILKLKYESHQAQAVEEFEQKNSMFNEDKFSDDEDFQKNSYSFINAIPGKAAEAEQGQSRLSRCLARLRCCSAPKDFRRTRRRLGKKISYLSLYEYCHIVDKHENQVAELKQQIIDLKIKLVERKKSENTVITEAERGPSET